MEGKLLTAGNRVKWWARAGQRMGGGLLDLVYPAACAGCEAGTVEVAAAFCSDCLDRLALFEGPVCRRCGATVPAGGDRPECARCRGVKLWFDETIALGEYAGLLRRWILEMKRRSGDRLALALAGLIWERCGERLLAAEVDVVVPMAIHWRRRWEHGTNSAAVLAERLAARLGLPLAEGMLRRRRNTPPQFTLPPSERRANVRGAFSVNAGYHLSKARVLVVDDVLTTGATCSEAARVLKRLGASRVTAVVAARTLRN